MEERTIDDEFNLSKVKDEPIDDDTDDDDASRNSEYHEVEVDVKLEVEDKTYDPSECDGVKDGTGEYNDSDFKLENEAEDETLSNHCPSVLKISEDGSIVHTEDNELGYSAIDFIPSTNIITIGSSRIAKRFMKKFLCNYCSFSTSHRGAMPRHMRQHSRIKPKPIECDNCNMKFSTNRDFESHMIKYHPDIKMHQCDKCSFSTAFKKYLKRHTDWMHIDTNTDGKNEIFKCKLCTFECNLEQKLIKHLKTKHSFNNNYPCGECNKIFNSASSLNQHKLKEHDEENVFKCDVCSYSCKTKRTMEAHSRKVHNKRLISDINAGITSLI